MKSYQIGELSSLLGLSADTLRYYEKIGLLPPVTRSASGLRLYDDKDVSRLNFIRRAQRMNFTLAEIARLMEMRENPQSARSEVRALMEKKLHDVEVHIEELNTLRREMRLLINLCHRAAGGCPIIEDIDQAS
jgi:DNA-binding transcriptional MerR regulator